MKELYGLRVRVDSGSGEVFYGQLQGIRGDGDVTIWDEASGGPLHIGPVLDVRDARYACGSCGTLCNRLFEEWCAACYRAWAQVNQPKPTCEECGTVGAAWRDPIRETSDGKIKCGSCHAKTGQVFQNRWAAPAVMNVQPRAVCEANAYGQCEGSVKPRGGAMLCNAHAGKHRVR